MNELCRCDELASDVLPHMNSDFLLCQMLSRLLNSSHPEDLKAANKLIKEMVQEVNTLSFSFLFSSPHSFGAVMCDFLGTGVKWCTQSGAITERGNWEIALWVFASFAE